MKLCVFYTAAVSLFVVVSVDCRSHRKYSLQVRDEQPSRTNSNNTDLIFGHAFSLERQDPKRNIKDDTSVEFYGEGRIQRDFIIYTDTLRTWNDAKALCEAKGMRLAEGDGVDMVELRLSLVNRYDINQFTWIGARGNGTSQIWQSGSVLSNSSPLWYPGSPSSWALAITRCLELDTTKYYAKHSPKTPYYSVACTNRYWTLCERVIYHCDPSCQNGGSCNAAKECVCQPGWMGDSCDIACGRVNRKMKIVNGTKTEIHEYPWQVLVIGRGMCGGSLLNDKWVITAAHCTSAGTAITVTLGNHLLDESESAEIKVPVKIFHDHPQYNRATLEYDFSLLELETSLNLASIGPHIAPVCLPEAADPSQYDDVEAITSGWGTTSFGGSISNVLLEATVKTMTNSHCNEVFKYSGAIKDSMICAAAPGKDSCQGDSGGPLVTEVDGFYNLIGAVSWGSGGCAHSDYPGVYARITYVIDWITTTTSQSGRSANQN